MNVETNTIMPTLDRTSQHQLTERLQILHDSRDRERLTGPEATMIVPVYNVAEYVAECLTSILASQATVDLEMIIIDDGSTDDSVSRIQQILDEHQPPQTLFITQSNQGLSAVRNRGVGLATGNYVGFLDSDDMLTMGGMRVLIDFALNNDCDIVMGKSLVFDSRNHNVHPFYDDAIWQRIFEKGGMTRIFSRHEEPCLFLLEPNANYRLVRRELFSRYGLVYPEGKLFEDPPVHYRMLAKAARIGLVAVPYYWYRVNRPGKITAQRSRRRFDVLAVARESFAGLQDTDMTDAAGAGAISGLLRIVLWCGSMTRPEDRREFFESACQVFSEMAPEPWVQRFMAWEIPEIERLSLHALLNKETDWLVSVSFGRNRPLASALFLIRIGRTDHLLFRVRQLLANKLPPFFR